MPIRVTGLNSNLDTESIIKEMVAAKQTKVDKLKKEQTKLGWKQESWKALNDKFNKFYNSFLSDMRYQSNYAKKTTKVSDSNAVSVTTDGNAMNSIQEMQIERLAKQGFLSGGKITSAGGNVTSGSNLASTLGIAVGSKFELNVNGTTTEITVDADTTIGSVVSKLNSSGVNANFDAANQRIYIGSKALGKDNNFTLTATNADGTDALNKLGILTYGESAKAIYQSYQNLATDPAARQAAVDKDIASLLSKYTAQADSLNAAKDTLNTERTAILDNYNTQIVDVRIDLTDDGARASRRSDIDTRLAQLEAIADPTEDDKQEKLKLNTELYCFNTYEANQAALASNQTQLDNLYQPDASGDAYLNADGTAGSKITLEANTNIQNRIDEAIDILNNYAALTGSPESHMESGCDAKISLNGATYESSTNDFKINGLNITCLKETSDKITLTTESDNSGVFNMIKNFFKGYNDIINEMDKLYNAESSKGYEPLTSEEKSAMTDKDIENWEKKIKDSLLRRDSNLSSVSQTMKEIMASGYTVNGKVMHLSDFGIETLGYWDSEDNEKGAYHINGDPDDENTKNRTSDDYILLSDMIKSDPNAVIDFFTGLSKEFYSKMGTVMQSVKDYRTGQNIYDDKKMKTDYDDYTSQIKEAEEKLADYEDKWYKKFASMETALARLQSSSSAITGLLGGK